MNREKALRMLARSGGVQNVVATLMSEHVTPTVVAAMRVLRSATKDAEVASQVLRSPNPNPNPDPNPNPNPNSNQVQRDGRAQRPDR